MSDSLLTQSTSHPAKCGACANVCDDCKTAWERDRYREALAVIEAQAGQLSARSIREYVRKVLSA